MARPLVMGRWVRRADIVMAPDGETVRMAMGPVHVLRGDIMVGSRTVCGLRLTTGFTAEYAGDDEYPSCRRCAAWVERYYEQEGI